MDKGGVLEMVHAVIIYSTLIRVLYQCNPPFPDPYWFHFSDKGYQCFQRFLSNNSNLLGYIDLDLLLERWTIRINFHK